MQAMTQPAPALGPDHLAGGYQPRIHLLGTSPQHCQRALVRGGTTLAGLRPVLPGGLLRPACPSRLPAAPRQRLARRPVFMEGRPGVAAVRSSDFLAIDNLLAP